MIIKKTEFTSTDAVAFFIILAMVIFKITGHNGSLDTAVAIVVGYYFGKRHIGLKEDVLKA